MSKVVDFLEDSVEWTGNTIGDVFDDTVEFTADTFDWGMNTIGDIVETVIMDPVDATLGQIPVVGDYIVPVGLTLAGQPELAAAYIGAKSAVDTGDPLTGALSGATSLATSEALGGLLGAEEAGTGVSSLTEGTGLATGGGATSLADSALSGVEAAANQSDDIIGSLISGLDASGTVTDASSSGILGDLLGGNTMDLGKLLTQGLSFGTEYFQNQDILNTLKDSQSNIMGRIESGFDVDDYTSSDAYNYQLSQGTDALQKALASQGLGQSGAAVKAATEYATNLANQNYQQGYSNWADQTQALVDATGNQGDILSQYQSSSSDSLNKLIASLLGGLA